MDEVIEAIEILFVESPTPQRPKKATLRDQFELDPDYARTGTHPELKEVIERLDPKTLGKIRDWLHDNCDRLVAEYGYSRWGWLRFFFGFTAWAEQLPPGMQLLPDKEDGLPIQGVAVRTDGRSGP